MNQKGFTLIELLAVIVILAVIALIATPIVMNSIEEARKSAAKNAAYGVIKAIEHDMALRVLDDQAWQVYGGLGTDANDDRCDYNFDTSSCTNNDFASSVDVQGTRPSRVDLVFDDANQINGGIMCINNYPLEISANGEVTNGGNGCD